MLKYLPLAIIIDLDDTLFDSRAMKKYYPKNNSREEWDEFHRHYNECFVNYPMATLFVGLKNCYKFIFITGREDKGNVKEVTLRMINSVFADIDYEIYFREENDYRESDETKRDIFNCFIKDKYKVIFAFDDEIKNIELWQSLGIETLHHGYGRQVA
jgi:predicted secreted acid phosphatase